MGGIVCLGGLDFGVIFFIYGLLNFVWCCVFVESRIFNYYKLVIISVKLLKG